MKLENSRWAAIVNPALKLFFNDQLELLLASFIKTYATPRHDACSLSLAVFEL